MKILQEDEAIRILSEGGVIIFPTDTAFGIGCRIDDPRSVSRVFSLRKRPETKATPVLVSSKSMALSYWRDSDAQRDALADKFWPGGLTIISRARMEKIPPLVMGGGDTIGLRMPNYSSLLSVISAVGVPILGPSANMHGEKTPFSSADVDPHLIEMVDGMLYGESKGRAASTVVDTCQVPWKIVRQGAVVL